MEKRIKRLEQFIAMALMAIPLVLFIVTDELRSSISSYAYSSADNLFVGLLWLTAAMFFYNAMYSKKAYNWIIGASLIGISLTDHLDHPIPHYAFTGLFFIGSIVIMVVFSSQKQRKYKIVVAILMLVALSGHFIFNWYSLLIAEWICMSPLSIHFIGESLNKID